LSLFRKLVLYEITGKPSMMEVDKGDSNQGKHWRWCAAEMQGVKGTHRNPLYFLAWGNAKTIEMCVFPDYLRTLLNGKIGVLTRKQGGFNVWLQAAFCLRDRR
jgi:hypothetical protein